MKRLLLVFACLALAFACTEDPSLDKGAGFGSAAFSGNPDGALRGTLAIKLSDQAADAVTEEARLTRSAVTRSGIGELDAVLEKFGATEFYRIIEYDEQYEALYSETGLSRWYRISFDESIPLEEIGADMAGVAGVSVVEYARTRPKPQWVRLPQQPTLARTDTPDTRTIWPMNDKWLSLQWSYDNSGSHPHFSTPKAKADIDLYDAWTLCTGDERIIVAVIDEPVQTNHPDLAANIWTKPGTADEHGKNFMVKNKPELDWISFDYDPSLEQPYIYADHGTHVAGTIAAVNDNRIGVCGIAGGKNGRGGVKIMSCQIMGYTVGEENPDADVQAFNYAMKNGAVIAQCSWGFTDSDGNDLSESAWNSSSLQSLRDAMNTFIRGAGANNPNFSDSPIKGGLIIFAAGNSGDVVGDMKTWPSAYDSVIAVGSMGWDFKPAYYSNYGSWVDITAPGGDVVTSGGYGDGTILSTVLQDPTMNFKDGRKGDEMFGYDLFQGTSMACPHVSGVAALGLSYAAQIGKQYTASEFKSLLLSSVYGIDSYFMGTKKSYYGKTLYLSNYISKMGGGCVDALKLLLAIKGTPAIYVKTGEATTVDFARYFGGSASKVKLTGADIATADLSKLGLSGVPNFSGSSMTFNCSKSGVLMMTLRATAGDTKISREFALVSRPGLADNGGWL